VGSEALVDDVTDVTFWRERAERAQARVELAEQRAERAEARPGRGVGRAGRGAVADVVRPVVGEGARRWGEGGPDGAGGARDPDADGSGEQAGDAGCGTDGQEGPPKKRGQRPGSKGHGRRDYSHLPTREEIHDVPPGQRVCPDCGREFTALGSEDSEQIDWQVRLIRVVHRRLRYRRACACPGQRTVTARPAPNPVPKGRFTAAFCARLLYLKFVLGLPVHRIARMLAAEGLAVPEGTLAGVLKALAGLLEPVETAIRSRNSAATHVHADETTWRVYQQVEDKTGHKWWLWVFIAEDTVVFRMDPTRSNSVVDTQFGITAADREAGKLPDGRRLVMSSDFFVVYQSLARMDGVDALWYWTHYAEPVIMPRLSWERFWPAGLEGLRSA
jgi:transposase